MENERDDSSCDGSAESSVVSQTTGTNYDKNATNAASQQNLEAAEIKRLVRKETRRVQLSRSFFLFLMLGATTVIVTLAYAVFNNQDRMELVLAVRLRDRRGASVRMTPSAVLNTLFCLSSTNSLITRLGRSRAQPTINLRRLLGRGEW
jgi:hypothetical protein